MDMVLPAFGSIGRLGSPTRWLGASPYQSTHPTVVTFVQHLTGLAIKSMITKKKKHSAACIYIYMYIISLFWKCAF